MDLKLISTEALKQIKAMLSWCENMHKETLNFYSEITKELNSRK